ncbi:Pickpocket protein 28 [Lucilia cuprina]|nr:Pickpocket protein 28 [Lucilia cuprina]
MELKSNKIEIHKPKSKLLPLHTYFKENMKRFLIETSLNGLKYIIDVHRNVWERGYYLISFSTVFTAGLYMAIYFLQKWQNTPVIISMSSKATSIQDVPFPAVTFCNMNQALASRVNDIEPDTPAYAMLQKICFQRYNYSRYKNYKPRFKGDNLVRFILKNTQSCSDMIIYCKYGPNEETCTDLFREILLDEGICCVFNQLHPFYLYKGEYEFIRDYTSSNGRTSIPVNWNLEDGYEDGDNLPKSYYPRKAAGSGVSMGLTVVLNAELDEYYCSSTNGPGFKMLLYNPVDAPHMRDTGLPIMLGQQTRVRINPKRMESIFSLRSTNPKDRQCYFSSEKNLLYFKYYTRRNCEMECDSKQMFRRCKCVPYHMPKIYANATTCFLNQMDCVVETERLILDPRNLKCKEDCLSGCHDLSYYPDMFVTPLASRDFNLQDPFFRNISKEVMHKDLALVQIYYRDNFFRGNIKVPYTGFTEFLSQTGGVMSLMVGFSVISIAEMFYFIFLKPFFDMFKRRNPLLLESKDNVKNVVSAKNNINKKFLFKRRKNLNNRVMNWNTNELQKYRNDRY